MREVGNEKWNAPGDSLEGNHEGWFIGIIPSFPTEHQQERTHPRKHRDDSMRNLVAGSFARIAAGPPTRTVGSSCASNLKRRAINSSSW